VRRQIKERESAKKQVAEIGAKMQRDLELF
jgi:hypothetical protein